MLPAYDIYAKELWPLGYGYPLWGPEPCLDFGEVRLGDVGYIRGDTSVSTMCGPDDPINARRGVPLGFEVFSPPDSMLRHHPDEITQTQLHSRSICSIEIRASVAAGDSNSEFGANTGAGLRYQCKEDFGALLLLKRPGHRTYLDCNLHIKRYICKYVSSWYEFANMHLGIGLEEKDIIFVSGFTKTTVWAEAAFNNGSANGELWASGGCLVPAISVSGEFHVSMSRCVKPSVFSRVGPSDRLPGASAENIEAYDEGHKYDQCIFINYHKMRTSKLWLPRVIHAAVGPHELPSDSSDDESSAPSHQSSTSTPTSDESDILQVFRSSGS